MEDEDKQQLVKEVFGGRGSGAKGRGSRVSFKSAEFVRLPRAVSSERLPTIAAIDFPITGWISVSIGCAPLSMTETLPFHSLLNPSSLSR